MQERIAVSISPNERGSDRAKHLALAISEDNRFMMPEFKEIEVDVQFSLNRGWGEYGSPKVVFQEPIDYFNVELKECSDYVQSALGKDGHLYQQVLTMREAGHRCSIAVLGGSNQITEAIIDALQTRYKGKELAFNIASYESRLIDFEANCEAIRCPVWHWQTSPWKRLLSNAHKILMGGDLLGYRPRPAEGERELVAASGLLKGIGPSVMSTILKEYQLGFVPRGDYATPIEELPGIGKKRCAQISPLVRMVYPNRVRA
ncbi:hypothetical protein M0R72_20470 [Candidatus Pacearchaeota archaeon]|jgi:hypothetical protein|nr:hypothetical protein [Candidatus Pacearchaeota archaeon]